jgi:predicted nucleic acid-binding protein
MVLVDSSVLIDYLNVKVTLKTIALESFLDDGRTIVLGDLILMELLQGAPSEKHASLILNGLKEFQSIAICDPRCAIQAAQHYRTLRGLGITIRKTIDTLIATRCIIDNIPLLYSDRDFDPFVVHLGLIPAVAS